MKKRTSQTQINKERDKTHDPLLSVITPTQNSMVYLETCIQSVLNQSYPYLEHIFVDGGSTDGTLDLLTRYQDMYPERIRFVSEPEKSLGEAVNHGFSLARGQILNWLDSDDVYEPDAVMAVVDFFRNNPDAYFVFGGCNMIDEQGEVIAHFITREFEIRDALYNRHHIYLGSMFFRREVMERVGMFNAIANDLDFYIRVSKAFRMYRIEETLSSWRHHKDSISHGEGNIRSKIRKEKLRQDCRLCIKYTRNIFAPRCLRYYVTLLSPLVVLFRPVIGRLYPKINSRLGLDYYPFRPIEGEKKDSP